MKSHARVVVIGGGIMGAGILYHLAKEGWSDVVLVEKGELTSGSTWHAAAFIPHFMGNPAMAKIHSYATKTYRELEAETGQATGFHDCGTIRLGSTQNEFDWYCRVRTMLRSQGTECHIIGSEEINKLHPLMDLHDVKFGIYTPGDGHTDPAGSTNALAIGARARGAEIYLRNRVVDINLRPDNLWDVVTEKGTITAEHVVNAAGSFAPQIGAMIGAKVPVFSIPHHYLVTEAVDEVIALETETPTIRDPMASCYYREEQNGLIIGPYEMSGAEVWGLDGIDWSFDTELLPPNLDVLLPCLEAASKRLPVFANAGIKRTVCGPITHVPDLGILLGPATGFRNFWMCCGSSVGVTQGPGAGKYLAQWMVHGQAEIDVGALDARRYGDWAVGNYGVEQSLEGYHQMFQVHLPGEHLDVGRPARPTSVYETLKSRGAVFAEKCGWEVPKWFSHNGHAEEFSFRRTNWFESVAAECTAVRERVGVSDHSSIAKFDVLGADATAFLKRVISNPLPVVEGETSVGTALNHLAGIECEFTIVNLADGHYFLTSPSVEQYHCLDWLTLCAKEFSDIVIDDVTEKYGAFALVGPRSRDVLAKLTKTDLNNAAFPVATAAKMDVAGLNALALRTSGLGEVGWEIHVDSDHAAQLYGALLEAGSEYQIADFGLYATNSLRMEKARAVVGVDFAAPTTSAEVDQREVVCPENEFIGADALTRHVAEGAKRHLVYLELDADDADAFGVEQVFSDDREVGITTSGAYGHTVNKSLLFAFVDADCATPGSKLEVDILGNRTVARILERALYDPDNLRPQGA